MADSSNSSKSSKTSSTAETVERNILALAQAPQLPKQVVPFVVKAAPVIGKVAQKIEDLIPVVQRLYEKLLVQWEKLKPYKPELLVPSFVGLIMCFFGGSFLTVIAAWEAFMMCGYESTKDCVLMIVEDLKKIADANAKDDARDDNNDGVVDVKQISSQELLQRKVLLFLRTLDPQRVSVAVTGINAGFLAVLATLKVKFAKTITLGNSIGGALEPPAKQYVLPLVEQVLPTEYRKWAWPLISYFIRTTAISIAWFVQRVISSFHSAIRGGLMFSRNIMEYLSVMDIYKIDHKKSYLDELVGYGLALLGLWFQLGLGFALPFPLNVVLFPVTLVEYFLIWAIAK